jgi:hypothetical protein
MVSYKITSIRFSVHFYWLNKMLTRRGEESRDRARSGWAWGSEDHRRPPDQREHQHHDQHDRQRRGRSGSPGGEPPDQHRDSSQRACWE